MSTVDYQLNSGIATLTLSNGKVNALSPEVIAELHQALDRAEQDKAVVVLTGQAGIFSAGYDLRVMQASLDSARGLVELGSTLCQRLLMHPYPVVMACSGHAVAKGAFLLLCADYRIGVSGDFQLGLNEVRIGMPMHAAGICLAQGRLAPSFVQRAVINAEMFSPSVAVTASFLDEVVNPEQLMVRAQHVAQALSQLNQPAMRATKRTIRADWLNKLAAAIEQDRHYVGVE